MCAITRHSALTHGLKRAVTGQNPAYPLTRTLIGPFSSLCSVSVRAPARNPWNALRLPVPLSAQWTEGSECGKRGTHKGILTILTIYCYLAPDFYF